MPSFALLPLLALFALIALTSSAALLLSGHGTPQLAAHVAFALGLLPLILAAMGYFVPVLTRSGQPGLAARSAPGVALIGGGLAVTSFAGDSSPTGLALSALLGGLGAIMLGAWTLHLIRRMPGPRHRGLDWYLAALAFLLLALLAVALMPLFPAQRNALRLFHLHANVLGFVGITVLGTLQVLLPTCLGQADPDAGLRLRRDVKWATPGVLLIAAGAALSPLPEPVAGLGTIIAIIGALVFGSVVMRTLHAWHVRFGQALLQVHGAAPSLVAATLGMLGLLVSGLAHGTGWLPARSAVAGFVIAFLLPLVGGAAAQLLPVWLYPGAQGPKQWTLRARLCRWGGIRGLVLLLLGLALTIAS